MISAVLCSYVMTFIITSSNIMAPIRGIISERTEFLKYNHKHPIYCRMCTGMWISLVVAMCYQMGISDFFIIYGASYFLATQER